MTNLQRWESYTDGLSSPQNYINWGWRYTIAASLQRRVWLSADHRRCYANMYIPLVGKAGVGKGNLISAVYDLLSHHKLEVDDVMKRLQPEDQAVIHKVVEEDAKLSTEASNLGKVTEKPLLIPIAADATTYEALIQTMGRCYRRMHYKEFDEKQQRDLLRIYGHSSICFCLQEMASLFRKNTESTVNFLLQAYDCGDKYEYRTKTGGIDRVLRLCLNFLAGTTPDFMQEVFDDKLLAQGFSSRSFFIYALKNRKSQFFVPDHTEEQKKHKEELLVHIRDLTKLYGQVKMDVATVNWLQTWWEHYEQTPSCRASNSSKLDAYYARKNIHVMKVAMTLHFSESLELHIPLERFQEAIEILHEEEKTMHLALNFTGTNPLSRLSNKVLEILRQGRRLYCDLLIECYSLGGQKELGEVLEYLCLTNQIKSTQEKDEHTQADIVWWEIKK